jgi:EcoRII C terminal
MKLHVGVRKKARDVVEGRESRMTMRTMKKRVILGIAVCRRQHPIACREVHREGPLASGLNEAARIRSKHLLTLETGISDRQMGLMQTAQLVLVMPEAIRRRYPPTQGDRIVPVATFVDEVRRL